MTNKKFKITERKPQYNSRGHITAYLCTLRVSGVFAGIYYVPVKCKITNAAQRTIKAQLAAIIDRIPQEEYESMLRLTVK